MPKGLLSRLLRGSMPERAPWTPVASQDPEAILTAAAARVPGTRIVRGDGGGYTLIEPSPLEAMASDSYDVNPGGATGLHGNVERAINPGDNLAGYEQYQWLVRTIGQYRQVNPDFEFGYFRKPLMLACTGAKFSLKRPKRLQSDEATYSDLKNSLSPPFEWFNDNVNRTKQGQRAGVAELCRWMLNHLLEGGSAGWCASVGWVQINGLWWRTITKVSAYGGSQLGLVLSNDGNHTEQWYIRYLPQVKRMGFEAGFPQGYDSTQYRDNPQWTPVDPDEANERGVGPKSGKYRGVLKYMHPEGARSKYPLPPFTSLINTMTCSWLLQKDNLQTLARKQKIVWVWSFDWGILKELDIPVNDIVTVRGDGTTSVIKGAVTIWKEARENVLRGRQGGQEIFIPSWIKLEQKEPGLDLIQATDTISQFEEQLTRNSGFFQDERGRYSKEESEEWARARHLYDREQVLVPFIQELYDIIWRENVALWHQRNKLDPESLNPFVYETKAGTRARKAQAAPSRQGVYRQRVTLTKALLDGDIEELAPRATLIPNSAVRSKDLEVLGKLTDGGHFPESVIHEAAGYDHEELTVQMRHQAINDTVEMDPSRIGLWVPQPGYQQRSVNYDFGADGKVAITDAQDAHRRSPGRPTELGTTSE